MNPKIHSDRQWGRAIGWGGFNSADAAGHRCDLALVRETVARPKYALDLTQFAALDAAAELAIQNIKTASPRATPAAKQAARATLSAADAAVEAYRAAALQAVNKAVWGERKAG